MSEDDRDRLWHAGNLAEPHDAPDKARRVRDMFDAVAPTYERVNTVCSLGRDASWRRRAVRLAGVRETDRVLDVACGTGDLTRAFAAAGPRSVVGTDFSHEMIRLAPAKSNGAIRWCEADAQRLPFDDGQFDVVSCAFGIRNLEHLEAGLSEFCRVLDGDGRAVILEFSLPKNTVLRQLFLFYFLKIMPGLAGWISGDRTGAYRYLPRSVLRFPERRQIVDQLRRAGFERVEVHPLTFGIAVAYLAYKSR